MENYYVQYEFIPVSFSYVSGATKIGVFLLAMIGLYVVKKINGALLLLSFFIASILSVAVFSSALGFNRESFFRKQLVEGKCAVISGVVEKYEIEPAGRGKFESFQVAGRRFQFSDSLDDVGFRQTVRTGTVLRNGVQVRIHHWGNHILRLELKKSEGTHDLQK